MSILFTFKGELDRRLIKRPEDQNNRVLKFDKLINTTLEHHACTRHCRVHFMEKKNMIASLRQLPDQEFQGAFKK